MSQRIEWLDVAKGAAVLLVVLHHSILHAGQAGLAHEAYVTADFYLRQMRMPLFFLASGITTAFAMKYSYAGYTMKKLVPIAWIFFVWSMVLGVVLDGASLLSPLSDTGVLTYLGKSIFDPGYGLWFVLSLFFLAFVALLVRGVPAWGILTAAFLVAIANGLKLGPKDIPLFRDFMVHNTMNYAVFFFFGLYFKDQIIRLSQQKTALYSGLIVGLVCFLGLDILRQFGDFSAIVKSLPVLRSAAGVLAGLCAAVILSRWSGFGDLLVWFGKRSLGIFVAHGLFLIPLTKVSFDFLAPLPIAPYFTPLGLTILSVAGALALYLALTKLGCRWVYFFPHGAITRLITRTRQS